MPVTYSIDSPTPTHTSSELEPYVPYTMYTTEARDLVLMPTRIVRQLASRSRHPPAPARSSAKDETLPSRERGMLTETGTHLGKCTLYNGKPECPQIPIKRCNFVSQSVSLSIGDEGVITRIRQLPKPSPVLTSPHES